MVPLQFGNVNIHVVYGLLKLLSSNLQGFNFTLKVEKIQGLKMTFYQEMLYISSDLENTKQKNFQ